MSLAPTAAGYEKPIAIHEMTDSSACCHFKLFSIYYLQLLSPSRNTHFEFIISRQIRRWNNANTSVYNLARNREWESYLDTTVLVIGILSLFLWPILYAGFPASIIGLVLGIIVRRRQKSGIATAGIILSGLGLLITLVNLKVNIIDILLKKYFQY
jgi:hypothetical protein